MKISTLLLISQCLLSEARFAPSNKDTESDVAAMTRSSAIQRLGEARPSPNLRGGDRRLSKKEQRQKQGKKGKHKLNLFRQPTKYAKNRGKKVNRRRVNRLIVYLQQIKAAGKVNRTEIELKFQSTFHMNIHEVVAAIEQNVASLNIEELQLLQFLRTIVAAMKTEDAQAIRAQFGARIGGVNRSGGTIIGSSTGTISQSRGNGNLDSALEDDHDRAVPELAEMSEVIYEEVLDSPSGLSTTYPVSEIAAMALDSIEDDDDIDDDPEVDDDDGDYESASITALTVGDEEDDGEADDDDAEADDDTASVEMSFSPSSNSTLKPLAIVADDGTNNYWIGECQGDCDYNSDCEVGLVCGFRHYEGDNVGLGDISVPGCSLDPREVGTGSDDFCHKPETSNTIVIMADRELELSLESYPLGRCQGDCWGDEDCLGDLICVYFDDDRKDVQDCVGWAEETYSYCLEP